MTLQLALEQIQRPSWWSENDPQEYKYMRHGKASGPVKKSNVLAHIRANGRRSDAALLVKLTGRWTGATRRPVEQPVAMTDKAMTDQAGLKAVMEEIGQLNIKSGSRVDVMQAIADRVIAPAGIRYLAIDGPIAGMASLVPVGATRPMN